MSLKSEKALARASAAFARDAAHKAGAVEAAMALASHAFPVGATTSRKIVSGFFPYQSEIDVRPLLGRLAGEGWMTSLPVVIAKNTPLEFRRWYVGEPTIPGKWNIPRPPDDAEIVDPDVLLVPMLAFDRAGYRLGYGGGFYDRTLAKLRGMKPIVAIGVAYAPQEVPNVARDELDQPLDYIMTEKDVIRCG
jgi:5-formyltetrahydrofolate cyclo-ligase